MTLYAIALYGIPAVLALITILIGIQGVRFYLTEVVFGNRTYEDRE